MPTIEHWIRMYSSENPQIRLRAAKALLQRPQEASLDILVDILLGLSWQGLGAKVEKVLLGRRDAELVPKMMDLLGSTDTFVREVACNVLGHRGDVSATPHLLRMIDDPQMMVRRAAAFGLAWLRDGSALPMLQQQFERHQDDDPNVVIAVQCALDSLANKTQSPEQIMAQLLIDQYEARVRDRLVEPEVGSLRQSAERLAEVLFLPSFHPETLLQVALRNTGTVIRMATMTTSIWYYQQAAELHRMGDTSHSLSTPPELFEEIRDIGETKASQFWRTIDELAPESIPTSNRIGLDGMSVHAFHRMGAVVASFVAWSPRQDSPQGSFIGVLYDLAWKELTSKTAVERLEQLHGYLGLGLPCRWIEGDVKCLRVFGNLSSRHESGLRRLLASAPTGEPWVMDMTNFEGMGTILYPIFIEFASKRRFVVWAVSAAALYHLQAMGLAGEKVFETAEAAVASLKQE